jgi:hypothetical protein
MKILVFKICSAYSKQMNYPAASYGVPVRPLADQSENLVRPRGAGNLPAGRQVKPLSAYRRIQKGALNQ